MKRKWFLGCSGGLAVLVVGCFCLRLIGEKLDKDALDHELELGRRQGMVTSWTEFAAGIKPAKDSENSASFYRQLHPGTITKADIPALEADLLLRSSPALVEQVKAELERDKSALVTIDTAAARPRCWFNRDWTKGMAVLMPEFSTMKFSARLVGLRGSLAAAEGHPDAAVHDAGEMLQIARQSGEEGGEISRLVDDAISFTTLHLLCDWAYKHPNEPAYVRALAADVDAMKPPDLTYIHRADWLELNDVLKMSTTPKGRRDLGLKEDDVQSFEKVAPVFLSRPKADINIAKTMRHVWEAYKEPPKGRAEKIDALQSNLAPSLLAYPTGSNLYSMLSNGGSSHTGELYDLFFAAKKQSYLAAIRAFAGRAIARSIETKDLLSPFDGTPLTYTYDGRQIVITISCKDTDIDLTPLKIPSDLELNPKKRGAPVGSLP